MGKAAERTYRIRRDVVNKLRADAGLSLGKLAASIDVSENALRNWLKGGPAFLANVARLSEKLGVETQDLLESEAESPDAKQSAAFAPLFQLPAEVADFTGRKDEISVMVSRLRGESSSVGSIALRGMGGIGKTSLAVMVAHQVKDHFPDAQLMLDLRGMSDRPSTPIEAMSRVIRSFRSDAGELPNVTEDLLPIYRSTLAAKRALIILDNAKDEVQVQHLVTVPSPVGFIITSRNAVAADCVKIIDLDALTASESLALLRGLLTRGTDAELSEVAELCGWLPLALRVAGDFLRLSKDWSLERYIGALSDKAKRLANLRGRTKEKDVEAVLSLSAQQLASDDEMLAARWQMLAAFDEADFFQSDIGLSLFRLEERMAASMWGMSRNGRLDTESAFAALTALANRSLIQIDDIYSYRFHDLMHPIALNVFSYSEGHRLAATSPFRFDVAHARIANGLHDASVRSSGYSLSTVVEDADVERHIERYLRGVVPDEIVDINAALLLGESFTMRRIRRKGDEFKKMGDWAKAVESYEEQLRRSIGIGDQVQTTEAYLALGEVYAKWGQTKKAVVAYFEPALGLAHANKYRLLEAKALLALAESPASLTELEPKQYAQLAFDIYVEECESVAASNVCSKYRLVASRIETHEDD